jgi:hypothetical protein
MAEVYIVAIKGVKPLLVHAPTGLGDRPKLRRGEHLDPKAEAESCLYLMKLDDKTVPCIPSVNIKACIREAGRNYKVSGRRATFAGMIRAALDVKPYPYVPLIQKGWQVDIRPVVVQRSRILRARPRFDEWALEFELVNNDPTVIHSETLRRILIDAGKYYGLGDFRPEFGLFEVSRFEAKR